MGNAFSRELTLMCPQFIAIIGTVSVEIALVSRFWTRIFAVAWSLSYVLTFPWLIIIPLVSVSGFLLQGSDKSASHSHPLSVI